MIWFCFSKVIFFVLIVIAACCISPSYVRHAWKVWVIFLILGLLICLMPPFSPFRSHRDRSSFFLLAIFIRYEYMKNWSCIDDCLQCLWSACRPECTFVYRWLSVYLSLKLDFNFKRIFIWIFLVYALGVLDKSAFSNASSIHSGEHVPRLCFWLTVLAFVCYVSLLITTFWGKVGVVTQSDWRGLAE